MTLDKVCKMLKQMKLPLAYNHFKSEQQTPYLVYMVSETESFAADNKVYHKEDRFAIELYTSKKDTHSETRLEVLLEDHEVYYEKYEAYLESEKMYQIRYEI